MAISDQIGRLTTLRNNIRTKLINLGILPAASTSATLSECYNVLSNVIGLGASSYTPTTTTQTIPSGRYLSGVQTINAIPSAYIIPSGTSVITSNGTVDVAAYASASINVQPALQSKTVTPTESVQNVTPDANVYGLSKVTVNAIPNTYLIPSGTITLSSSGTFDVGSYASADVTVTGEPSGNWMEYSYSSVFSHRGGILHIQEDINSNFSHCFRGAIILSIDGTDKISVLPSNCFLNASFFLSEINFRNVGEVNRAAFLNATTYISNDLSIYFDNLSDFGEYPLFGAFCFHTETTSPDRHIDLYFPNISSFGLCAFNYSTSTPPYTSVSANETAETVASKFSYGNTIRKIYAPLVTSIPSYCFEYCCYLSEIITSQISTIGDAAFFGCYRLSEFNFDKITSIGVGALGATGFTTVNLPMFSGTLNRTFIPYFYMRAGYGYSVIGTATRIINFSASLCKSLMNTFAGCTSLENVHLPKVTNIYSECFCYCVKLSVISLPALTTISGNYNFASCFALTTISLPALTTISGGYNFASCSALTSINLPNYSYTFATDRMFYSCINLSTASFPGTSCLSGAFMFSGCYNLISLFFLGSSVCALGRTILAMFSSTPVSTYSTSAGRWASIFVPASLLAQYKAATNWATISSKIFAYEDYF